MVIVAVSALDKYAGVTQTFNEHLTANIIQLSTWLYNQNKKEYDNINMRHEDISKSCLTSANMSSGVFNGGIPVDIAK